MTTTPVCAKPTAQLAYVVEQATEFLSERVAPLSVPVVCDEPRAPAGLAGYALVGSVHFPSGTWFLQPFRWSASDLVTVLHECLHQYGLIAGLDGRIWLEEGLVESVAVDLLPAFARRMTGKRMWATPVYADWVAQVRSLSHRVTKANWKSPAARRWRITQVTTAPSMRLTVTNAPVARWVKR